MKKSLLLALSIFLLYRKQLAETAVDNILAEIYIEKIR